MHGYRNEEYVSIHAPAWGATASLINAGMAMGFQSTLPRGERLHPYGDRPQNEVFQSTLPRGERPPVSTPAFMSFDVSIHAPAWGATVSERPKGTLSKVSIHAPAWGATAVYESYHDVQKFQSTLPRGERPGTAGDASSILGVSIHAPAWGATKG